jgi:hypothetical protein
LIATLKEEPQEEQEEKVLLFSTRVKPLKFSSELKTVLGRVPKVVPDFVFEREFQKGRSKAEVGQRKVLGFCVAVLAEVSESVVAVAD